MLVLKSQVPRSDPIFISLDGIHNHALLTKIPVHHDGVVHIGPILLEPHAIKIGLRELLWLATSISEHSLNSITLLFCCCSPGPARVSVSI